VTGPPTTFAHVSFHSMSDGQAAGVHVRELYRALERQGWKGTLVTRPARLRVLGYAWVVLVALRLLKHVDVLYVRAHPAAVLLLAIASRRQKTTILEVNGLLEDLTDRYPSMTRLRGLFARLDRTALNFPDGIVAVAPGLATWIVEQTSGRARVIVVANAADRTRFHERVPARHDLQPPYVAYCGTLAPWQGIETLLEAVRHPHWPTAVRLVVAGEGPLRPHVLAAVASGAPIQYLGALKHEEIPAVLRGSLASISARTRRDASPVKLYEALACGVPVVASAVTGQGEIVDLTMSGITFEPGNAQQLAAAVNQLESSPAVAAAMGTNALRASHGQDWDARAADVLAFVTALQKPLTGGSCAEPRSLS
jgi:glycosyltransferase involved in cell wall biosynthesis